MQQIQIEGIFTRKWGFDGRQNRAGGDGVNVGIGKHRLSKTEGFVESYRNDEEGKCLG